MFYICSRLEDEVKVIEEILKEEIGEKLSEKRLKVIDKCLLIKYLSLNITKEFIDTTGRSKLDFSLLEW